MDNVKMVPCGRCGTYYGEGWNSNGGCPACQHIIGYPPEFYNTDEYKKERELKRAETYAARVTAIVPSEMNQQDFDAIVTDLSTNDWLDGSAFDMVKQLVEHILSVDPRFTIKTRP